MDSESGFCQTWLNKTEIGQEMTGEKSCVCYVGVVREKMFQHCSESHTWTDTHSEPSLRKVMEQ